MALSLVTILTMVGRAGCQLWQLRCMSVFCAAQHLHAQVVCALGGSFGEVGRDPHTGELINSDPGWCSL